MAVIKLARSHWEAPRVKQENHTQITNPNCSSLLSMCMFSALCQFNRHYACFCFLVNEKNESTQRMAFRFVREREKNSRETVSGAGVVVLIFFCFIFSLWYRNCHLCSDLTLCFIILCYIFHVITQTHTRRSHFSLCDSVLGSGWSSHLV